MKVCMLSAVPGSVDGIRVVTYEAGVEYDLGATAGERALAQALIEAGFAEETSAAKASAAGDAQANLGPSLESGAGADETPAPGKPGRKPKAQ